MSEKGTSYVFISGVTSGIGKATALEFCDENNFLLLVGRDEYELEKTKREVEEAGGKCSTHLCDFSDPSQIESLYTELKSKYEIINIAINCAGTEGRIKPIIKNTLDDYDYVMGVNARATWLNLKNQISIMLNNGGGSIVNVASILGHIGSKYSSIYCASKSAIIGMTKSLALEYANKNISINVVSPGAVDTPMLRRIHGDDLGTFCLTHPLKRPAKAVEIAKAIKWIAMKECPFLIGESLIIDGGFSIQ